MSVVVATVTESLLSLDGLLDAVGSPAAGAVACFVGRIRDHDPEASGEVLSLDYTCHPDASRLIGEIARAAASALDAEGVALVAVAHRVGRLEVGDAALIACVSSPHRELAFRLCAQLVEDVKRDLPIWKQQHEASGRSVWSNLGLEPS
jgi:molybdopterin synthase catalytic subunit